MALLSQHKIAQLFGEPIKIEAVSGTVDGSSHVDLIPGESFVLSNIPYGTSQNGVEGNFICMEGQRLINGQMRIVQTIGWMTPQGRLLNLGSLYKRNHLGAMNPANVGIPTSSANRAELLPLLFGGTVTVGNKEEIEVNRFQPKPDETPTVKGSWSGFTFVPKV